MQLSADIINNVKNIILLAGAKALQCQSQELKVIHKSDNSPVTDADVLVSDFITQELQNILPNIPVISEEAHPPNEIGEIFWLIDPIDGTKSYIEQKEDYTINIALLINNIPELGFIYAPALDVLYYTDENQMLAMHVSGNKTAFQITQTTTPSIATSTHHHNEFIEQFIQHNFIKNIKKVASAIKLCLVASGEVDIYPKFGKTMEWDTAAGHAIIKATGGDIIDFNGNSLQYGKQDFVNPNFIACNKYYRDSALDMLKFLENPK